MVSDEAGDTKVRERQVMYLIFAIFTTESAFVGGSRGRFAVGWNRKTSGL